MAYGNDYVSTEEVLSEVHLRREVVSVSEQAVDCFKRAKFYRLSSDDRVAQLLSKLPEKILIRGEICTCKQDF